jgi:HD-GYP domain-containing protein (c-di-GMP phosphodiesterase class II)
MSQGTISDSGSLATAEYIRRLEDRIDHLAEIGKALSKEKDSSRLLEMILLESRRIAHADGGTLYMMTDDHRLRFEIMMTGSLCLHLGGTSNKAVPFDPIPICTADGKPNRHMVAAYAVITGETVNIEDAYEAEGFDFSGTRAYDQQTGYRSQSFLTVPLKNHLDEIIGALQLLNALDPETGDIIPFSPRIQKLVEGLASQAAVAITKKNLIDDLENLFESFIRLIASAIDAKSPYTGGHCSRVPILASMLAEAVDRTAEGPLANVQFTEEEKRELNIAAWLHDCGKITTPEHVVDKSTKLETIHDRMDTVAVRFEVMKRDEELKFRKEADQGNLCEATRRLDEDLAFLREINMGGEMMSPEKMDRVREIAKHRWKQEGEWKPLLTEDEVNNLCISRGTLTSDERRIINDHIVQTISMLTRLPYPKHLKNVPEFAGGHHEKMDGSGYPKGLCGEEMSLQARIMTIADIYEALTASDRPYKKGMSPAQAVTILENMKCEGHIDPVLFDVFVNEKVHEAYASRSADSEIR